MMMMMMSVSTTEAGKTWGRGQSDMFSSYQTVKHAYCCLTAVREPYWQTSTSSTTQIPESHDAISLWVAPIHLTSDTPQSAGTLHSHSLNALSLVQLLKYRSSPVHRRFVRLDAASINAPSVYHDTNALQCTS